MLYDGWKIIVGVIIGIGLLSSPFFFNGLKAAKAPEAELAPKAEAAKRKQITVKTS